jgi:acyl-CoA reductase-like NAD-dependent aldehyde dehydrogenase
MTTHTVINPATEQAVADVEMADLAATDAAIERAAAAFPAWRDVPPGEKARLLRRFAALVDACIEELAELEVRNSGHTWGNAVWEAGNVRDVLNYYSAAPERLTGHQIPASSASSCRGTSRCRSPDGASRRPWRRATPSC